MKKACEKDGIELNDPKSVVSVPVIRVLGYEISHNCLKPDPERLKPLQEMPPPSNMKLQKKVVGLFAYYSKWIVSYSDKIKPLSSNTEFPLPKSALDAFNRLKSEVVNCAVSTIDEDKPFVVETDASGYAIAATLSQEGRPVAFFSRTLQPSEMNYPPVETEALAIVESVRYWKHFLTNKHFTLITDQKSVHFMYNVNHRKKIKNDKIYRWRVELSCYSFDIQYRKGVDNITADTFSRVIDSTSNNQKMIREMHDYLGGPGVTRLFHYLKSKNIPVTLEEVRATLSSCNVCAEC